MIVSTVGVLRRDNGTVDTIGNNRYYETMAYKAEYVDPYWEADVASQVPFDSPWMLGEAERESDLAANNMHEAVVDEIARKLEGGV